MNVVIINCFDTYNERANSAYDFFQRNGHNVTRVKSNFSHMKKKYISENSKKDILIETKPYYKNLSVKRLISHRDFAKKSVQNASKLKPDMLYVILPANSLAKYSALYKRKNPDVLLIFDVMDLWPETFPLNSFKKTVPFKMWRNIREDNIRYSDFIITECNLFKDILTKGYDTEKIQTVHLAKKNINVKKFRNPSNDSLNVAYLGSINNIIDIPFIESILSYFIKSIPVNLHIVGDGEKTNELIETCSKIGVKVQFYGKVYDHQEKQNIFDKCHYGLNIMKEQVCVGLTMKSLDYFQHGLPIINNITNDTEELVDNYKVGINVKNNTMLLNIDINEILTESKEYSENIEAMFEEKFTLDVFNKSLEYIVNEVVTNEKSI